MVFKILCQEKKSERDLNRNKILGDINSLKRMIVLNNIKFYSTN